MTKSATSRHLKTATALVAILALAACNPTTTAGTQQAAAQLPALPATLPLAAGSATAATAAPAAGALPATTRLRAVQVARPADRYAYAESARSFSDTIGSAPPDYGFDYGGVRPWAWQGYDNSVEFVEPVRDGYRYYYYRPGASTPYFVRDPDYGYGYDDGQLAVVYAPDGSVLPYGAYGARSDYAARYYARARALYDASRQRHAVIAANWAARQAAVDSAEQRWFEQRAAQRDWQAYHDSVAQAQEQHWAQEQARRRADATRYDAWRSDDFRSPPPPRAIPVAWAAAGWAADARRYAPPTSGFNGTAPARQQAAPSERQRISAPAQIAPVQNAPAPEPHRQAPVPIEPSRPTPAAAPPRFIAPPRSASRATEPDHRASQAPPERAQHPVPSQPQRSAPQRGSEEPRADRPHPDRPHPDRPHPDRPASPSQSQPIPQREVPRPRPEQPAPMAQRRPPVEAPARVNVQPQRPPQRPEPAPQRAPAAPQPHAQPHVQPHPGPPAHDHPPAAARPERPQRQP